jgi:hypothetical protein
MPSLSQPRLGHPVSSVTVYRPVPARVIDVKIHRDTPRNAPGAAAAEVLRVETSGPATTHTAVRGADEPSRTAGRLRRRVRYVMLGVALQLMAQAAGVSFIDVLNIYGLLVTLGLLPAFREPYALHDHREPRGARPRSRGFLSSGGGT